MKVATTLENLKKKFPHEPEYFQAVEEVLNSIEEEYNKHPEFEANNLIERLCIPDVVPAIYAYISTDRSLKTAAATAKK